MAAMFCASKCPVSARPLYLWLLAFGWVAITLLLSPLATHVAPWWYCSPQAKFARQYPYGAAVSITMRRAHSVSAVHIAVCARVCMSFT